MHRAVLVAMSLLVAGILGAQAPAASSPGAPVTVAWSALTPRIRPGKLPFPPLARMAGAQGTVAVRVVVDSSGRVARTEAIEGPTLLRPAAEAWCRQWVFAPVVVDGMPVPAETRLDLAFRLEGAAPTVQPPTGAVLDIEVAPSTEGVPVDLEAIRAEALHWLASLGLPSVELGHCDPGRTLSVRVVIQAARSRDGIFFHEVRAQGCLLRDRRLSFDTPAEPAKACFSTHLLAQRGEEGFQASLMETVRRSLGDLSGPPAPPPPPVRGKGPGAVPTQLVGGRPGAVDFEFSQIRVRYQPPPPPYPFEAKIHRIQGVAIIDLVVSPAGLPVQAEALAGPPELLATAIRYALAWKFEPALLNGVPQYARFKLTMPFRLR